MFAAPAARMKQRDGTAGMGDCGFEPSASANRVLQKSVHNGAWRYAGGISQRGGPFKQKPHIMGNQAAFAWANPQSPIQVCSLKRSAHKNRQEITGFLYFHCKFLTKNIIIFDFVNLKKRTKQKDRIGLFA